jgi:hypothetical protein
LQINLGAAAHLAYGWAEDRFTISCCPAHLTAPETELVNFNYTNLSEMM